MTTDTGAPLGPWRLDLCSLAAEGGGYALLHMQNGSVRAQRVLYVVNPTAGLGASAHLGRRLAGGAGATSSPDLEVVLVAAESFAALRDQAAAVLAGEPRPDALIVQGGDGMVSMGAGLVAGTGVPLGIVPSGTGNDFARSARLERGAPAAGIERMLTSLRMGTAGIRDVDVIRLSADGVEHVAINSVNIGFDAVVNRRANELQKLPGTARYVAALLESVRRFSPLEFGVSVDDGPMRSVTAELLSILNGSSIGGGIRVAPKAVIDDGVLDLFVVGRLPRIGLLMLFPLAMAGLHTRLPPVTLERVTSIRVQIPGGVLIYADGEELHGPGRDACTLDVRVDAGAVRLIEPTERA
ncbi:diacylglycerol/lipid kinase family protein [Pseudoclavibacter helvolus]|uniref:diacylglycerol/lipid kinase family protein n=1 Tax=Pseudoclavibacter helvolus TaxID=255205 RepID=UPI0012E8FF69|nr:diacylglycerol kinase family protein [Pseudoclavibacter helvolus]